MDRTHSSINSLLEQATCIAKRSKEAAGETESTEGYKRRQTEELIKFANDNGLWIDLSHLNITYMDRGGENEVFHDGKAMILTPQMRQDCSSGRCIVYRLQDSQ